MDKRMLFALTLFGVVTCMMITACGGGDYEVTAETQGNWADVADTTWYDSTKTEFEIDTAEKLAGLAKLVNEGNTFNKKTVKLTANIDLGGKQWTPIGYKGMTFEGTFDGGENTISNLYAKYGLSNTSANNGIGLFGKTTSPAIIKNLNVENAEVAGSLNIGVVVGNPYTGKGITNINVTGDVKVDAWWYAGVIAGNGYASPVDDCHVSVNSGSYIKGNDGSYIAGIVGFRGEGGMTIMNCSVEGLSISGVDRLGGISGIAQYGNSIIRCSIENVTINASEDECTSVGLIAGANNGTKANPSIVSDNTIVDSHAYIGDREVIGSTGGTNTNGLTELTFVGSGIEIVKETKTVDGKNVTETFLTKGVLETFVPSTSIKESSEGDVTYDIPIAIDLPTGTYMGQQTVSILAAASNTTIYYTVDGAEPTASSTVYTAPVTITPTCTLKAIVVIGNNDVSSDVVSATYTAPVAPSAPTYTIEGTEVSQGIYTGTVTVTLSGTDVRYTTDGSAPSATTGTVGTSVSVTSSCTIKAVSVSEWNLCSTVVEIPITIQTVSEEGTTTTTTPPEEVVVGGETMTKTETTEVNTNTNTTTTTTELSKDNVTTQATVVVKDGAVQENTITTTIDSTANLDTSITTAMAQINENTTPGTGVKVEIVINTGSDIKEIEISGASIDAIANDDNAALTVSNNEVAVTLDNATLEGLASGDVKVDVKEVSVTTLTPAQQDVVKDNIVVSIEVTDSEGYVDGLAGKAYIKIPLTPETADHDVYFVDTDGSLTKMKEIERTSEYIIVETNHFSEYVLMSASSAPIVPPIFIPMPDDDDFIPPMQAVKEDSKTTEIACIAAGAVAAMLAAILVATSRGRL